MTSKLIEIKTEGAAAHDALRRVENALVDQTPLWREVSEILYDQTMENFDHGGMPAWAALAPSTIAERTRDGTWPGRILIRSGQLKSAVHPFSGADEAGIGVATPYAAIQQLGGTIERKASRTSVRLRTKANGDLERQGATGKKKNLAVFAKAGQRRAVFVDTDVPAHSITIPARPYLPVTEDGRLQPEADESIVAALNGYLAEAWNA